MSAPHLATALEHIADRQPEAAAAYCTDRSLTWSEYDTRAARAAGYLVGEGLSPGSKVGIYLHNCLEYLEAQFGILKARGVPINVNFRYLEDELVYLLNNADCEALIFQRCFSPRLAEIRHRLPKVRLYIRVEDGTDHPLPGAIDFETALELAEPMARMERPSTDHFMLYTGGTTGLPKGVVYAIGDMVDSLATGGWRMLAGTDLQHLDASHLAQAAAERTRSGRQTVSLAAAPLMHGTGMLAGTLLPQLTGGAVVLIDEPGLDPGRLWQEVVRHRVSYLAIAGDVFARPLLAELKRAAAEGRPYDLSSLQIVLSAGVMWSREVKQEWLKHADLRLVDAVGSSEGSMAASVMTRDSAIDTARFTPSRSVKVFNDADEEVLPGSGETGQIATAANIPLGYYKDPQRSARTFRTIGGVRYSFPGDHATVGADGSIILLGRGSECINTGGEKVFPEEVEEALKRHARASDCLVVGLPDERYGHRLVAVLVPGEDGLADAAQIIEALRPHIAGYKLPKAVYLVDRIARSPNGKPDYVWARSIASALAGGRPG